MRQPKISHPGGMRDQAQSRQAACRMQPSLLKSGIAVTFLRGLNVVIGFALLAVLTRALGPDGLGIYAYATTFLMLAAIPISYGWAPLILRAAARALQDGNWPPVKYMFRRARLIAVIVTAVALGGGLLLAWIAPAGWPAAAGLTIALLLATIFYFDQLSALRTALLRGVGQAAQGQMPEMLVRPGVQLFILLVALVTGVVTLSLEFIFAALAVASISAYVFGAWLLSKSAPADLTQSVEAEHDPAWAKGANVFALSAGVIMVNSYIDLLLLGLIGTLEDVGLYKVAVQVSLAGALVYTSLNMIAVQRFATGYAAANFQEMQKTATVSARLSALAVVPLAIVLLIYGERLVPLLFGEAFAAALAPMLILTFAQFINAGSGMGRSLLMATGLEDVVAKTALLALAVKIAACLALIPPYGAEGAAAASALSLIVWNSVLWWLCWRRHSVDTSAVGWSFTRPQ
jgi:O-antigen/teichoic acid export membrane protein